VPVIAGQADGTERDLVIDGETGYLLEQINAPALAEKILLVLENDGIRNKMKAKCRAMIRDGWNIHNQVRRMAEAIRMAATDNITVGDCMAER